MRLPPEVLAALVDGLMKSERNTVNVGGLSIEVTLEHDTDSTLKDSGDWYGELVDVPGRPYNRGQRPDHFNGNAEVVHSDRWGRTWWQPPADAIRGTEGFAKLREVIRGWYSDEWHYIGVVVAVSKLCPCCDQLQEVDKQSVWGIESTCGEYHIAEVVADLLAGIEADE